MNTTLPKKQQVQIVFSILNKLDPLGFNKCECQRSQYLSDAKDIVNALNKRKIMLFFSLKVQEIFMESFEMKVKLKVCRRIVKEILFAFSNKPQADNQSLQYKTE